MRVQELGLRFKGWGSVRARMRNQGVRDREGQVCDMYSHLDLRVVLLSCLVFVQYKTGTIACFSNPHSNVINHHTTAAADISAPGGLLRVSRPMQGIFISEMTNSNSTNTRLISDLILCCFILSYLNISYLIVLYRIVSYRIVSYRIVSYTP